ncbi:MAG TPA: GNAT family N-acetyltransferase [Chitinophagales bacterium]|nr:GNAT family N-acetyltransferase [Chitinophagales bacterium]
MEIKRLREGDNLIAQNILQNFQDGIENGDALSSVNHLNDLLKNETCYLVAVLENNFAIGFALAYQFPSFYSKSPAAYLYDIEVLPDHRMKGIASVLITELHQHLKRNGVDEIWLGTAIENIPAQRLFSSTGAQKEAAAFYEYFYYLK